MCDWNTRITLGIEAPKQLANTTDEMRRAIREASRHSALIKNSLESGRYNGLSGEDTYVLLAYHALIELERHWQMNMKHASMLPGPFVINPQNGGSEG